MNEHPLNALPQGYRLQEYELVRVLGLGGFGVTYLGYDHNLDKPVAVKEYLPADIAVRTENKSIAPKASTFRVDFAWGLDRFLDEARTLARFDHRNIVKVYRYFEANGTAYIVMEYAEGETLSAFLSRKGALDESELKAILIPILDGLETVHAADFLHRDIKPANIILRDEDASPVLVDFGAARQAISGRSQSVTTIVTAGYAPIEQYSSRGNQGPWTDIYALGAVCYRALTGKAPVDSIERLTDDQLEPVSSKCIEKGSEGFLKAIDWALHVKEADRPNNKSEWYLALTAPEPISADVPTSQAVDSPPENLPVHDYRGFDRAGIHRDTGTQYDQHGLDQRGFDANGFDSEGYDRYGYGKDGFDRDGYRKVVRPNIGFWPWNWEDKEGYDLEGFHLESKLHKITGTKFGLDGYDWQVYDRDGYGRDGFNANKVDRLGYKKETTSYAPLGDRYNGSETYDSNGFDKKGFDKKGFNLAGIHKATKSEYDTSGYNRSGYDRNGFNRDGIHQATESKYDNGGYDKEGRDENGHRCYDIHGFHLSSKKHRQTSVEYDIEGYDADGYDNEGLSRTGFQKDGTWHYKPGNQYYDSRGFNKETGYHWATGTDIDPEGFSRGGWDDGLFGYDRSGFDRSGFNREGFHRETSTKFDPAGYDKDGYNKDGYDSHEIYGYNRAGYNRSGFHKKTNLHRETGTLFDPQGYDCNGFDLDGYDRKGLDSSGIDQDGYTINSYSGTLNIGKFHHETHINKDTGTEFNPQGFNWLGIHQTGKSNDPEGFDAFGRLYVIPLFHGDDFPTDSYSRRYLDWNGYDIKGYNREGFNWNGYDHRGFYYKGYHRDTKSILDNEGYDREGFSEAGHNRAGFDRDGYHKATGTTACPEGFDAEGFHAATGFHKETKKHRMTNSEYDTKGYNVEGYDRAGFDRFGFDGNDFDSEGFHSSGCDRHRYDRDGYDRSGFDRNGIHRDTGTELDLRGFIFKDIYDFPKRHQKTNMFQDPDGYDSNGWDRYGFDCDGIHRETLARYNRIGFDSKGLNQIGKRRSKTKKVLECLFRIDDWRDLAMLTVIIALAGFGITALLIQVTEPTVNEASNIVAEAGRKASSGESSTIVSVVDYLPGFLVNHWWSMPDFSQPEHVLESVLLFFVFVLFYLLRIMACFMAIAMICFTIGYFKTEERYYLQKEESAVNCWTALYMTLSATLGAFGIYRLFIIT